MIWTWTLETDGEIFVIWTSFHLCLMNYLFKLNTQNVLLELFRRKDAQTFYYVAVY